MEGVDVQQHPFSTLALDEDDWSGSLTSRFTPREKPSALTGYEAWWTSVQVEALRRRKNILPLLGIET
jgi:hypothetical protein